VRKVLLVDDESRPLRGRTSSSIEYIEEGGVETAEASLIEDAVLPAIIEGGAVLDGVERVTGDSVTIVVVKVAVFGAVSSPSSFELLVVDWDGVRAREMLTSGDGVEVLMVMTGSGVI
jgi:hypothetical protein